VNGIHPLRERSVGPAERFCFTGPRTAPPAALARDRQLQGWGGTSPSGEVGGMREAMGMMRRWLSPVTSVPLGLGLIAVAVALSAPWLGVIGGALLMAGLLVWLSSRSAV
jgi:hypothetical protein